MTRYLRRALALVAALPLMRYLWRQRGCIQSLEIQGGAPPCAR